MHLSISSSDPARRALLRIASVFAAVLLLAVLASEALLRTQVLPQDNFARHLEILQATEQPDAAFGDSHTARGFVAGQGFVNLAFPSEGISHMAWKARLHYAERQPGRVILQADPHLFATYRLNRAFEPYPEVVSGAPERSGLALTEPRHRARLVGYWTRFFGNGFSLKSKIVQTEDGALLSPGDFSALTARAQVLQARKRARTHQIGAPERVVRAEDEYTRLLDALVAKGAELCLVSYPVTEAYRSAVGGAHSERIAFFRDAAEVRGLRYVDARAAVTDPSLFRDSDHLNAEGAMQFRDVLLERCFS